jgi:hypothetical protein
MKISDYSLARRMKEIRKLKSQKQGRENNIDSQDWKKVLKHLTKE